MRKRYERYKYSGIDWIGEVPEHWIVTKLGYKSNMIVPMRDKPTEFDGDIPWIRIEDVDEKYICDSKSGQRVSKETVKKMNLKLYPTGTVLCTCSCNMGATVIVGKPMVSNQTFIGIVPRIDLNSEFLYYLMNANSRRLQHLATGAIQQYLSRHNFEHFKLSFPPINEQRKIVNFLNQKTSEIDSLIADKEKLIQRLQEYKQSVITEAVTKGLNPDVKMKDSGIEWIGEIPEDWDVCKLKFLFEEGYGGLKIGPFGSTLKGKTLEDGNYKIYNQANLIKNDFSLSRHFVSDKTYEKLSTYQVNPGDVLFSMMGTIGKCKSMPEGYMPGIMDSHLLKARLNKKITSEFFEYVYDKDNSNVVISQLLFNSNGSIMNGLSSTIVKNIVIVLPKIEVQEQIVEYLNRKTALIDLTVEDIILQIQKLKEYRQSLIYEAVTGKIDVREYGQTKQRLSNVN